MYDKTDDLPITDAERLVMEVLWECSPRTSSEITRAVQAHSDWQAKTVQTLIGRLAGKGMLHVHKQGRRHSYAPAIARDDFLRRKSRNFVQTFFQGRVTPLVAAFAETEKPSREDLRELRAYLDSLDAEHGENDA